MGVEISRSGINGLPVPEGANRYSPKTNRFYIYDETGDGLHSFWNDESSEWESVPQYDSAIDLEFDEDMAMAIVLT